MTCEAHRNRARLGLLALAGLLLVALLAAAGQAGAAGTAKKPVVKIVKIGVSGSFSGVTAFYGQQAKAGADVAVAELNAKKGATVKYQLVQADDTCTPDGGAAAYGSLIDVSKVAVILGSPCSSSVLGGMPVIEKARIPNLAVSATSPDITKNAGIGGNAYVWRMNLGDDVMAEIYAGYIARAGVTKLATIAVNNAYGQGAVAAYKDTLPRRNVQVVSTQFYTQGGGDFRPQLSQIRASGAEAMLIIGAHQDGVVMMKQFKELGLNIPVFARGDIVSKSFQEVAGDPNLGNGIREANNWDATYKAYPQFATAFEKRFKEAAGSYAVQAYLGVNVIAKAVEAGKGVTPAAIQRGLGKVSWKSPIGLIDFDSHHQAHHDMFILEFKNGKINLNQRLTTTGK
jgi:branched-chain amino acid transport system substrate-binding protein